MNPLFYLLIPFAAACLWIAIDWWMGYRKFNPPGIKHDRKHDKETTANSALDQGSDSVDGGSGF